MDANLRSIGLGAGSLHVFLNGILQPLCNHPRKASATRGPEHWFMTKNESARAGGKVSCFGYKHGAVMEGLRAGRPGGLALSAGKEDTQNVSA